MRDPATEVPAARPRHGLVPVYLAILGLCASLGCGAKAAPRSARVPVTVAVAVEQSVPFAITATGTIEAIQTAAVGSQVGGTVQRVAFREGAFVRAGQLLIQLDPRSFRAALDQALAALARDRARAATASADAQRAEKLFAQGMLSQSEWDQKRSDALALEATVQADSAAVSTARLNVEYAAIRAPISGHTGRKTVNEGDYVRAATSEPLVTIIQPDPIRVRFAIPEREVPALQRYRSENLRVEIAADGGARVIPGKLVFVDNAVDPGSGTLLLKGEVRNADGRLVPGQFVDVRLVLYVAPKSLVVPARAVSIGQQGPYVYVLKADSTVASRPVEVERTMGEVSVIASGLSAGEAVVTDGQLKLAQGAKVSVRSSIEDTP